MAEEFGLAARTSQRALTRHLVGRLTCALSQAAGNHSPAKTLLNNKIMDDRQIIHFLIAPGKLLGSDFLTWWIS